MSTTSENTKTPEGLRFNDGKLRYDILEPFAMQELARVFTEGAKKYAPNNWLKGMAWSKCLASMKRHIAAWEMGEDFDAETKCFHMAHAAWNALALVSYTKYAPQYDDRMHTHMPILKIGLDIDEVICDWVSAWVKRHNMKVPTSWFFDRDIVSRFNKMEEDGTLDEFYLGLQPRCEATDLPFEPHCYVTSRPVDTKITEQWLAAHGFPARPVITVKVGESKVEALKKAGVDIFVDDRWDNFVELNRAGVCTFLMDAPHNQRYNAGFKRIYSLKELNY